MKTYNVEITGIAPLMQHRFATEEHGANKPRGKKQVYVPKEEAEKACYRDAEGNLVAPSTQIVGALLKAGVKFKYEGKKTYKDTISAGIYIDQENIPILDKESKQATEYTIDARPVVVQRSRVVRWRPMYNDWKMKFSVTNIEEDNLDAPTLKDIFEYAGKIGIGDHRPRYGRFQVTEFKEAQ